MAARNTQRRPVTRVRLGGNPAGRDRMAASAGHDAAGGAPAAATPERSAPAVVIHRPDTLVSEEPMEIRVGGEQLAVTMRTPGNDFELAAGFLVSEGVVSRQDEVSAVRYCAGTGADGANTFNVVDVSLAPHVPAPDPQLARSFYTTSACGLCGKADIGAVRTHSHHAVATDPTRVSAAQLLSYPAQLRRRQELFDRTGGLHAAALFDNATGELLVLREDVGRHNAVDKVIGWALMAGRLPLAGTTLQVSGRASFELVQKASMAGIPVMSAVSAPSALAVDLAVEVGITLAGFVRGDSLVLYARADRVAIEGYEAGDGSADRTEPSRTEQCRTEPLPPERIAIEQEAGGLRQMQLNEGVLR